MGLAVTPADAAHVRAVAGLLGARPPDGPTTRREGGGPGAASLTVALGEDSALSDVDAARRVAAWQRLAEGLVVGGVAAVRVPMLPGWHPLTAVQDFARFHAARRGLPLAAALGEVLDAPVDGEPSGRWEGWLERCRRLPAEDPELWASISGGPRHADTLTGWVDQAAGVGLRWIGDLRGPTGVVAALPLALRAWAEEEASLRDDALRGAQICDLALCRHTRRLLLVRGAPTGDGPRDLHLGPPPPWPPDAFDPEPVPAEVRRVWARCADLAQARAAWRSGAASVREGAP